MIGLVCIIIIIACMVMWESHRRRMKKFDLRRYSDEEIDEGEIIYRNWFKCWVEPKIKVGAQRIVLDQQMIMALCEAMDPRFAAAVSPYSRRLRMTDYNNMYIDLR